MNMRRSWKVLPVAAALAVGIALGGGVAGGNGTAAAKERNPSTAETLRDARFWEQLTDVFGQAPLHLRSMHDHRLYVLPNGHILGLHFDNMNLARAKNLNWVVFGVPGVFTKADQQRVERQYGPGFTHFHDLKADTHGGKPGAKGAWFVHVGARDFRSPFGRVTAGEIDRRFMPTPPRR